MAGMNKDEMECPNCKQLAMPKVDEDDSHEIAMESVCKFCGVSYYDAIMELPPPCSAPPTRADTNRFPSSEIRRAEA